MVGGGVRPPPAIPSRTALGSPDVARKNERGQSPAGSLAHRHCRGVEDDKGATKDEVWAAVKAVCFELRGEGQGAEYRHQVFVLLADGAHSMWHCFLHPIP